jgi:hypothetical protein
MTLLRFIQVKVIDFFDQTGLAELVGGRDALETGITDLRAAALPLYAELLQLRERNEPLAGAVFDEQRYPHLTRFHGWIHDVLALPVPEPMLPWIERIVALAPALDGKVVDRMFGLLAFKSFGLAERELGRLLLFESLCVGQRFQLRRAGVDIEVLSGRCEDIESLAERELVKAETKHQYREALAGLDDPGGMIRVIMGASVASLDAYVETLRREVAWISRDIAKRLNARREILRALEQTDPADAVLIRNAYAEAFGDERVTVEQLRLRHPGLLGSVSSIAARKRLERALTRAPEPNAQRRVETLGDILVKHMKELES